MKPIVYLETTIVSYLTARPSRDLIIAAHQQITQEWWDSRRNNYDLYVSHPRHATALAHELATSNTCIGCVWPV